MASSTRVQIKDRFLGPVLTGGTMAGAAGVGIGYIAAILKPSPQIGLYTVGTGLNCLILGTMYSALREGFLHEIVTRNTDPPSTRQLTLASTAAGAATGAVGGYLLKGRPNIIPGAVAFGLLGFGGQLVYYLVDKYAFVGTANEQVVKEVFEGAGEMYKAQSSSWSKSSPIRSLSAHEYTSIMKGKRLAIEADIALVTEEISRLERGEKNKTSSLNRATYSQD